MTESIDSLIASARRASRQMIAAKLAPLMLTSNEYDLLAMVGQIGPLSLSSLSRALRRDNSSASRLVSDLTKDGHLVVNTDPAHGRRVQIRLTPAGAGILKRADSALSEFRRFAERGMGSPGAELLRQMLTAYLANLDGMVTPVKKTA